MMPANISAVLSLLLRKKRLIREVNECRRFCYFIHRCLACVTCQDSEKELFLSRSRSDVNIWSQHTNIFHYLLSQKCLQKSTAQMR